MKINTLQRQKGVMVRSRKVPQAKDSGPVAGRRPERRPLMRQENSTRAPNLKQ